MAAFAVLAVVVVGGVFAVFAFVNLRGKRKRRKKKRKKKSQSWLSQGWLGEARQRVAPWD